MQDVKLKSINNRYYDFYVENGQLATTDGLDTAIIICLFSDKRAESSEVADPAKRRGWIGDIIKLSTDKKIGSKLWLLDQARNTLSTRNKAKLEAEDALEVFIDEGLCTDIDVSVENTSSKSITIAINLTTNSGETQHYEELWRNTVDVGA